MTDRNGVVRERLPASVSPSEPPRVLSPSFEPERSKSRANARHGRGRTVYRSRCRELANPPEQETSPCSTQTSNSMSPPDDELLAEIGLDAHTIRRIRTEAGEEEALF